MGTKGWGMDGTSKPRAAMSSNIFNRPQPSASQAPKDTGIATTASESQIIDHIRKKIAARGARGIAGIARKFKIADDDGSKELDF